MKGIVFVLIIWLSTFVLLGYSRLVIANYIRTSNSSNGMLWFGANVQFGVLIGSIVAYLIVNTFSLFKEQYHVNKLNVNEIITRITYLIKVEVILFMNRKGNVFPTMI